jgi:hypothetical protein
VAQPEVISDRCADDALRPACATRGLPAREQRHAERDERDPDDGESDTFHLAEGLDGRYDCERDAMAALSGQGQTMPFKRAV